MGKCTGEEESSIRREIQAFLSEKGIGLPDLVSMSIWLLTRERSPVSRLIQYCIDIAGDQFISEEFYQNYPELLSFLSKSGCDNEEVLFRAYVLSHPDIFNCKQAGCHGKIIGGCPKMFCNDCGKVYYVNIEGISSLFCSRCVANELIECTEKSRRRRYLINAVR